MATLSNFKSEFIVASKWTGIVLGAILGIFLLIKVASFIKESISPTPPPPPTVSFGKLPAVFFPSGIKNKFSYTIDTLSGQLPNLPDRTNVYKMYKYGPDILAIQRASEKVATLGFNSHPERLSDILYRWTNPSPPIKNLVLNVNMASFNLYSSYSTDETVLSKTTFTNQTNAISTAKNFLQTLALYPQDIDEEKTMAVNFSINNGVITPTQSISLTKLISVYFFQKNIDDMPIVYPNGANSSMNLVIAGGDSSPQVINGRFFYQKVTDKSATYPTITADEAYDKLKKGEAYVASHDGNDLNIVIKKIYLGFYVEGREQEYLLPVVVFEGTNNFVAYVSVVKGEWIGN